MANPVYGSVLNIEALRNVPAYDTIGNVFVTGAVTASDGYGGEFWWDQYCNDVDDGSAVVKVNGIVDGRWRRVIFNSTSLGQVVLAQGSLGSQVPAVSVSATWNNVASTFKSIVLAVTDTTSGASSLLEEFTVGGASKWSVSKAGAVTAASTVTAPTLTVTSKLTVDANANTIIGNGAVATTATNGFLQINTCAGTPTGAPAGTVIGRAALVYDSTNKKLYVWDHGTAAWIILN